MVELHIEIIRPHAKSFVSNFSLDEATLASGRPIRIVVHLPGKERDPKEGGPKEREADTVEASPQKPGASNRAGGTGERNRDVLARIEGQHGPISQDLPTGSERRKGVSWRPQGWPGPLYRCIPSTGSCETPIGAAGSAGTLVTSKRERQHSNANSGVVPPFLRLINDFFALHVIKIRSHSARQSTQGEIQAYHADDHAVIPSICTLTLSCSGPCMVPSREVDAYRGLSMVIRTFGGDDDLLTASMDTCADGANVITKAQAASFGYKPVKGSQSVEMRVAGGQTITSLGAVKIPFRLHCEDEMRDAEFHVFDDLARHRAILSISLTMELGHLCRKDCAKCEEAQD